MKINWNALGVSVAALAAVPTARSFPPGLNTNTSRYWTQAVNSNSEISAVKAWDSVFEEYTRLCDKAKVYPFDNRSANNDEIYNRLIRARRTVIRFIEQHKINSELVVRTTERSVSMTSTGFVLRCSGHCDFAEEPPSVVNRLGIRKANRKYTTYWEQGLGDNAVFFVANEMIDMRGRWHYGYEVAVDIFPYVPGVGAASSKQLENFILKIIYLPILRAYRPLGLQHRLV